MNKSHTLLLTLEASTIAKLTRLHKTNAPHKKLVQEIKNAQVQASLLGGQSAVEQLNAALPDEDHATGYVTPKPVTLTTAISVAMLAVVTRTALIETFRQTSISTYAANDADGWIWETEGPHPCPFCLSMEGTIHPLTEEFESHPNCYCDTIPYFA
jgi:hypothetical protein